jgi:hypothetical protein
MHAAGFVKEIGFRKKDNVNNKIIEAFPFSKESGYNIYKVVNKKDLVLCHPEKNIEQLKK